MQARAAVLWGTEQDWSVEEVEVDPAKAGDVTVEWTVAGICHHDLMALGTGLCGKGGTIVVIGIAPMTQTQAAVNLFELAMRDGTNIRGVIAHG